MKLNALLLSVLLAACGTTLMLESPEVPYKNVSDTAQEVTPGTHEFYVNFELVIFQSQIEKYPNTWAAFQAALNEWAQRVPVRWVLLPNALGLEDRYGAVKIHFADLQDPVYGLPRGIVGMWEFWNGRILLDADILEISPTTVAYSVSLHEIGHMLGVPHIINFDEWGYTGYVVLPPGVDATGNVMYPSYIDGKTQDVLSELEIMLANLHLIDHWTNPNNAITGLDCHLNIVDK